jgi:hypothetical protein
MFRRWGVGFYRGGQSLGSTQEAAYPNSDPDSNTYGDPDGYTDGNGYVYANGYSHSDPDGYTNGNGYVYADANSVTRALCTRCHCGH